MMETPDEAREILGWWLPRITSILGANLINVTLHGSVTLQDYNPAWSDIDVCVVVDKPVSENTGRQIGLIHDRMRATYLDSGTWRSGQVIEGYYIPLEMAGDKNLCNSCYIAGGTTRKWAVCNPVMPFDRYMLAHFGKACVGETVFFAGPAEEDLKQQCMDDLKHVRVYEDQSAIWLAGMLHWLARSLVFWRDGQMLSKSAALQREIDSNSRYREAFKLALALRRAGSTVAGEHFAELYTLYSRLADTVADELMQYLEKSSPM